MGRKYLLDVLVKVFEKKKDKKLAEEVHLRLKNIIDKDIKIWFKSDILFSGILHSETVI